MLNFHTIYQTLFFIADSQRKLVHGKGNLNHLQLLKNYFIPSLGTVTKN